MCKSADRILSVVYKLSQVVLYIILFFFQIPKQVYMLRLYRPVVYGRFLAYIYFTVIYLWSIIEKINYQACIRAIFYLIEYAYNWVKVNKLTIPSFFVSKLSVIVCTICICSQSLLSVLKRVCIIEALRILPTKHSPSALSNMLYNSIT